MSIVERLKIEQSDIGIALQAQHIGEGRFGLSPGMARGHDRGAKRFATQRQQSPFDREMSPAMLPGDGRGRHEDLERPTVGREGRDHGKIPVAPLADAEVVRPGEMRPQYIGRRGQIGRVAENVDIAARYVDPERERTGHMRIEITQGRQDASPDDRLLIGNGQGCFSSAGRP